MFPSVQLKGFSGVNGMMGTYPPSKPPIIRRFEIMHHYYYFSDNDVCHHTHSPQRAPLYTVQEGTGTDK